MSRMQLVGLILFMALFLVLSGFIFSKITITNDFGLGASGSDILAQSGVPGGSQSLLDIIFNSIGTSIGSGIGSVFDWITFWD